jgi:hypothetical protein
MKSLPTHRQGRGSRAPRRLSFGARAPGTFLLGCTFATALGACAAAPPVASGPVVCPHARGTFTATAKFEKQPSGDLFVAVRLDAPARSDIGYVDDEPFVQGATVVSHGRIGSTMELRMKLDSDLRAPPITFNPAIECPAGKDGLSVVLSWTNVADGEPITATIEDRG